MSDLILHHYDTSPYAEKIRLALGLKGLAWKSVDIPVIMPKPDLVVLTGGYRRTPVLQAGADVYCDTECIAAELERRHPRPTLYPSGSAGLAAMIAGWAATALFPAAVGYAFATNAEKIPMEFHKDRAAMRGIDQVDLDRMKSSGPRHLERLRALLGWVDGMLADGRAYLTGGDAGLVDLSVYHSLWFLSRNGRRVEACLEPYRHVTAWMARVASIGHGARTELHAHEALHIAHDAEPGAESGVDPANALGLKAGDRIAVTAEDTGRDPVQGALTGLSVERVTLRRHDAHVGDVAVHFPRVGYQIRKL
jgi:glutathione S-transferase